MIMDNPEYYNYSEIEEIILNYKSTDAVKLLISLLNTDKDEIEETFETAMICYYIDSDLKNTLKELNIILEMNPSYMEALLLKGQILAGIHKYDEAIETLNSIHPNVLPYGYKKLIEFITEYNHKDTLFYCVFDFYSYWEYVYVESNSFKRIRNKSIDYLEDKVFDRGLIWQELDNSITEKLPVISGTRLSEEEPAVKANNIENSKNCIVCGKELKTNEKSLCRSCLRKQYASRVIKKLVSVVQPEVPFKKKDLSSLNLDDIQIKDYIWTLQEFNLIDVDNNKYKLKDKDTLNSFRIESQMEPIDFDSLEKENNVNKTCQICGKTLPISQFYKSSEGYEDTCKACKKLVITAKYLEDVIGYVGFDNEFDAEELTEYVPNQNQIMGMIWSLQDNDLLIGNESKTYILVDKTKCLDFLDKYNPDYEFKESNIKPKTNVKSKSKVKESSDNSKIEKDDADRIEIDSNFANQRKEQMGIVLKVLKEGKTKKEAANIADIPSYKIDHWYKMGKQGFGEDNIDFYKQMEDIESNLPDSSENERKQMNFVLKLLRQGKSKEEIANLTELDESTFVSWYTQGKEKASVNTDYFYNEVQKIIEEKNKVKNLKNQLKEFIPKFKDLDNRIVESKVDSSELKSIRNDIKSNIENLKKSSGFKEIDKLENQLSNAKKSYNELNNRVDVEFRTIFGNDDVDELIAENSSEIINLRNEYGNSPGVIVELSKISLLNSKLDFNLKNGKSIDYNMLLDVKKRLDKLESNLQNNSQFTDFDNDSTIKKSTEELLEFLYSITGSDDLSLKVSYIYYLKSNGLSIKEGKIIREKIRRDIVGGMLETSDEVQLRFDEYININQTTEKQVNEKSDNEEEVNEDQTNEKQTKYMTELINYLYSIRDSIQFKSSSIVGLSRGNLSYDDLNQIIDKIITEIKSSDLKNKDEVCSRFIELLDKRKAEKINELLNELYNIVGEDNLSDSFITKLSNNNLTETNGRYIKKIIEEKIKNYDIKNKIVIDVEITKLIDEEIKRQNNAFNKLDEMFNEYNTYLNNLSPQEKQEIKNRVEKSIKNDRLSYMNIPIELKNITEEFKESKENENQKEDIIKEDESSNDKKESGGLFSKLKKLFSKK